MTCRLSCCAILVTWLFASAVPSQARKHDTTVELVSFHGWSDAYRISNGIVDIVVVPRIGRIMAYEFTGHPETNPIWINPDEAGHAPGPDWRNFGGDKVWPAPQGDWGKHMRQDRNWPPDPAIDPGNFQISRIDNGVRLTGTESAAFGLSIVRDIVLPPGGSSVTIKDTFIKSTAASGDADGFPIGIWSITQTRGEETAYLPIDIHSLAVLGGYIAIDEGKPHPGYRGSNWTVDDGTLAITTKGLSRGNKVGVDDRAGWVADLDPKNVLFVQKFAYRPGGPYLDNGTDAQVYANDKPAYIEIEVHSPGENLRAGQSMSRTITWNLKRLPRAPKNASELVGWVDNTGR